MTPEQIILVRGSWAKVEHDTDAVAELFYGKVFEMDPSARALFTGDMKEQGAKLMKMIATAIDSLHRIETIVPEIQDLGRRHVGYGVTEEQYDTVGRALLWTLEQGLGDDFTPELEDAWTVVYGALASIMKEAH
uniref:Hemoglobin-like flavoprotein n=1 Tax=Candidatus Kentrum sp. FM TaxID=2126340 RepID=A0A450SB23_9GAMM|nr:MAG: Hemoglobin-like flavoprotein [Candidatus Kentron sp. FM]VFJ49630.1 MAG: Hemoglobin-like flavoprotein [Candidatus Kentron sp. FM]VFK12705.1 MAG: Hemoglobin-like flavoprotein [Candidatus Kentron sp. FM]